MMALFQIAPAVLLCVHTLVSPQQMHVSTLLNQN